MPVPRALPALPPHGHGVAVEGGAEGGRRAGDVQQNGADQAAGHAAHHQAHDQGDADVGLQSIGDGDEQGDGHRAAQAGDRAEDNAHEGAQGDVKQALQGHNRGKARCDHTKIKHLCDPPLTQDALGQHQEEIVTESGNRPRRG